MKNSGSAVISSNKVDLKQLAIDAAIAGDWNQAVELNREVLTNDSNDVEALNRLARAYFILGQVETAKKNYKKVLTIDPYNQIASNNLKRLSKIDGQTNEPDDGHNKHLIDFNVFIGEPGTIKLVNLVKVATPQLLSQLTCGERLEIQTKKHGAIITTSGSIYLGALPDDLAFLLLSLINGGNKYEVFVKKVTNKNLQVLLRETYRSPKFTGQPSFIEIANKTYFMPLRRESLATETSAILNSEEESEDDFTPVVSTSDEDNEEEE